MLKLLSSWFALWHAAQLQQLIYLAAVKADMHIHKVHTYTCDCIHPGWVESESPMVFVASLVEADQARQLCVSSLEIFTTSYSSIMSRVNNRSVCYSTTRLKFHLNATRTLALISPQILRVHQHHHYA